MQLPGPAGDLLQQVPIPSSPIIGRDEDIAALCNLLTDPHVRLVTLTGPGGVGKTRLALAVIEQLHGSYADGIHYLQLAGLNDPTLVAPAIAQQLGVQEAGGQAIVQGLQSALQDQRLLLVLDNFEHLMPAVSDLSALLAGCSHMTLLATSRVSLHLRAERIYQVQPLGAASRTPGSLADDPLTSDAVRLFVERAQSVDPGYQITPENATTISTICTRLDGLPLAIELAAARINILRPDDLLDRLDRRLTLLKDLNYDAPHRQQTLWNTVAWSYDLLSPDQQSVFRRLAVFSGGWTIDAAEEIITDGDGLNVVDNLSELVDHNLVYLRDEGGTARFNMLETIAEFARTLLPEESSVDSIRNRHARWCIRIAQECSQAIRSGELELFKRMYPDIANVRVALDWLAGTGNSAEYAQLIIAMHETWFWASSIGEGRKRCAEIERHPVMFPIDTQIPLYRSVAIFAFVSGEFDKAVPFMDGGLVMWRRAGRPPNGHGIPIARAWYAIETGDPHMAYELLEEQKAATPRAGFLGVEIGTTSHLALAALVSGQLEMALQYAEEAYALSKGNPNLALQLAVASEISGLVFWSSGKTPEALQRILSSIDACEGISNHLNAAYSLVVLAKIASELGKPNHAARLLLCVEYLCRRTNGSLLLPEREIYEELTAALRQQIGNEQVNAIYDSFRQPSVESVYAEARETITLLLSLLKQEQPHNLSNREVDVLRLIAEGLKDREIANALFISPRTVTTHVTNILNKLGVSSRSAAVAAAVRQDII